MTPFERAEAATLWNLLAELPPGAPPQFVEVMSEGGGGSTTLLTHLKDRFVRAGWDVLALEAYPGRGASVTSLPELARALSAGLSPASREAIDVTVREALGARRRRTRFSRRLL
ncbi:MAG: hypothetical protein U0166_24405 [Acidobacteriota bacterium]